MTTEERLPLGQVLSYALPASAMALIMVSVAIYLPNYYTDELGVSAGMLSWVFLAGRVWDAVTDPLMGHISDGTRSRWGRRRPYFIVSALPIWLVFYLIWSPSPGLSTQGTFVHLLVCYILLYSFWTVFSVPYASLGMELTPNYHERTRIFGFRQAFIMAGTAVGMLAPFAFAQLMGDKAAGYSMMALVFGGIGAALIITTFVRVRERRAVADAETFSFFVGLKTTFSNHAFVILLLVYLASYVGGSFIAPLSIFMAKYVIKEEWAMQPVMIAYLLGSMLSIPIWLELSKRLGKNRTFSIGFIVGMLGYAASTTYYEGTWIRWVVLAVVVGAANGCTMTLGPALAADVIDSDELVTGARREGAFMGIWSFADKAAVGLAVFIGMQGLEYIGYEPNVDQSEEVIAGMKFLYCVLPALLQLVAFLIFQRFPITPERHERIRAELAASRGEGG
ncbi:MAG: MFS transporter [Deltaproteobacteria bacterium]|nr:MFS transporter [Deltaproteobacteria bacterium]MBW2294677.1 MFS transporter [Deltaproteobacteria bacterium]MBW2390766.1 MFS transporter [Deltaproteobacteria bacterium]